MLLWFCGTGGVGGGRVDCTFGWLKLLSQLGVLAATLGEPADRVKRRVVHRRRVVVLRRPAVEVNHNRFALDVC